MPTFASIFESQLTNSGAAGVGLDCGRDPGRCFRGGADFATVTSRSTVTVFVGSPSPPQPTTGAATITPASSTSAAYHRIRSTGTGSGRSGGRDVVVGGVLNHPHGAP